MPLEHRREGKRRSRMPRRKAVLGAIRAGSPNAELQSLYNDFVHDLCPHQVETEMCPLVRMRLAGSRREHVTTKHVDRDGCRDHSYATDVFPGLPECAGRG